MEGFSGPQQCSPRHLSVHVAGMGCRSCVRLVTGRLRDVSGVRILMADADTCTVDLYGTMTGREVKAALADLDFDVEVLTE
ncbi:heavy-metal-associated domain-containing protein [Nocardioides antri]|uniref:Heavy-metal-associated domain-containing protein n=1 Tax=Nocardioides antri TaxID=2607659 RepID=A0A5B1M6H2_9ACTN|nr:heavy metal-associated domain-containing protein [Nocardioides antri]KAA1427397.1 heavy-metal-associated domain-containing protein [Nocardioides antri]